MRRKELKWNKREEKIIETSEKRKIKCENDKKGMGPKAWIYKLDAYGE